jgi:catechol 2,3-dioxygenase-like lactoylglutathione lyase family enzyme
MTTVSVRYIVNDISEAVAFYTHRLGFQVRMHPNDLFAMLVRGDLRLVLVKPVGSDMAGGGAAMPDGTMQQPGGWNRFSLETDDLVASVAALMAPGGVHFRSDIVTGVGGKQIILDDPSGNPIELFQPILPEASLDPPKT